MAANSTLLRVVLAYLNSEIGHVAVLGLTMYLAWIGAGGVDRIGSGWGPPAHGENSLRHSCIMPDYPLYRSFASLLRCPLSMQN